MHLDSYSSNSGTHTWLHVRTTCEKKFAQRFCACFIVELEHEYTECERMYTDIHADKIPVDRIMWVSLRLVPINETQHQFSFP